MDKDELVSLILVIISAIFLVIGAVIWVHPPGAIT